MPSKNFRPSIRFSEHVAPQAEANALERWKSISTIVSAIAIPLVLALAGYFIQQKLAGDGLKKDYVAIATSILKEDSKIQEPDLRRWAVAVLELNSPIPFNAKVKEGLESGNAFRIAFPIAYPPPPDQCMKAPSKERIAPLIKKLRKESLADTKSLIDQYDRLIAVAVEAEIEFSEDRIRLTCMQRYGRMVYESSVRLAGTSDHIDPPSGPRPGK
jgi:hypothetical protein